MNQGNDTMTLGPGATTMTGWTVTTNNLAWIGPTNPFGITAQSGGYSVDLQGYSDAFPYGGVKQTISTQVGAQYELSFYIGAGFNGTSTIEASAGATSGSRSYSTTGGVSWQQATLDFTATSTNTLISLAGTSASNSGIYLGLDSVSVVETAPPPSSVPEPATFGLAGLGGLCIATGICFRRRKAAAV